MYTYKLPNTYNYKTDLRISLILSTFQELLVPNANRTLTLECANIDFRSRKEDFESLMSIQKVLIMRNSALKQSVDMDTINPTWNLKSLENIEGINEQTRTFKKYLKN